MVLATSHVIVCVLPSCQVTAVLGEVTRNGPAVASESKETSCDLRHFDVHSLLAADDFVHTSQFRDWTVTKATGVRKLCIYFD